MSENTNPDSDYTTSDTTAPEEWQAVRRFAATLTSQRNRLANAVRRIEAGETDASKLDPLRELQATQDAIRKAMPDLARVSPDGKPVDFSVRDLLASYWDTVARRKNTASTGLKHLDDFLSGGLETQRLVCVLGTPNVGKTTFVHQIADHVADSGRPVLYVTSEDTPGALFAKTLARVGQLPYTAVLKGWDSERAKINAALAAQMDRVSTDRLRYLDATGGVTLDMIRDKAAAHFAEFPAEKGGGPGVLIVDYLQQIARDIKGMAGLQQDLREVVTQVTKRLRSIALELDCCVIAITSQNRANYSRSETHGAMASAKESGDIEYSCDVLMALTEDRDKNRVAPVGMVPVLLHVDKNRQGQRHKTVALNFWEDRQHFTEVAE